MSIARVLRTVLASLYLLVGIGFGVPTTHGAAHAASATDRSAVSASMIDCADHAAGRPMQHHASKAPCAPVGKIADHRHCPNCPVGGSCYDAPTGMTIVDATLVAVRAASPLTLRPTDDPTGRPPLPDPRPPRAVV